MKSQLRDALDASSDASRDGSGGLLSCAVSGLACTYGRTTACTYGRACDETIDFSLATNYANRTRQEGLLLREQRLCVSTCTFVLVNQVN